MAHRICTDAGTRFGLDHVKVGLLPFMGGCMEILRRLLAPLRLASTLDPLPLIRQSFDLIYSARVSNSADDALQIGYLKTGDDIVMNPNHVLAKSKSVVLAMADAGYRSESGDKSIYAIGERGVAALNVSLYLLDQAGRIDPMDKVIGERLAHILCGGDLTTPQWVSEDYILELEREAFLSLCGDERTQVRMQDFIA
jgi:3-hydroxyacyl-CoA dehydrogenase